MLQKSSYFNNLDLEENESAASTPGKKTTRPTLSPFHLASLPLTPNIPMNLTSSASLDSYSFARNRSIHGSKDNYKKNHRRLHRSRGDSAKIGKISPRDICKTDGKNSRLNISCSWINLADENEKLRQDLEIVKKTNIQHRVSCGFAFEAYRRQLKCISELKIKIKEKTNECAARLILHHLLLNSWRIRQTALDHLLSDNVQLHKTIENLSLQLRVLRHMENTQKEKVNGRTLEVNLLKEELIHIKKENKQIKLELEKVEEERDGLELRIGNRSQENTKLQLELKLQTEKKENLVHSLKLEKERANNSEAQNVDFKRQINDSKRQLRELIIQSSQWQEKASSFESDTWNLRLQVETREKIVQDLHQETEGIKKEQEKLISIKSKLQKRLEGTSVKLNDSLNQKSELNRSLQESNTKLEERLQQTLDLQTDLERVKQENELLRSDLYNFTLHNIRRRRAWGNALYYFVSPIVAFREFFFGHSHNRVSHHTRT